MSRQPALWKIAASSLFGNESLALSNTIGVDDVQKAKDKFVHLLKRHHKTTSFWTSIKTLGESVRQSKINKPKVIVKKKPKSNYNIRTRSSAVKSSPRTKRKPTKPKHTKPKPNVTPNLTLESLHNQFMEVQAATTAALDRVVQVVNTLTAAKPKTPAITPPDTKRRGKRKRHRHRSPDTPTSSSCTESSPSPRRHSSRHRRTRNMQRQSFMSMGMIQPAGQPVWGMMRTPLMMSPQMIHSPAMMGSSQMIQSPQILMPQSGLMCNMYNNVQPQQPRAP